ncbi:MAG TPA: DUF2797 domain-containing protein [Polyangiaceae bacterium]|nr:DUF2797 domain-containing protein [Polyangiaceae bacterium]
MTEIPRLETGLLAAYGCDQDGGFLVVDDLSHPGWQRTRLTVREAQLTLQALAGRFCTGRFDLASGKSEPCPERAALRDESFEQCLACHRATGFNPAFYNAPELSAQQQLRNLEPHLVYLAHFGAGTLKVGMTHARRGIHRLLEQGARMGVLLARFEDAYRARALEERIARDLDVPEAIRPARKRHLLGVPFSAPVVQAELRARVEQIQLLEPELRIEPELVELDRFYGGSALLEKTFTDLSETEPLAISGRCAGMIGDVLLTEQAGQRYMLSLGALVGRRVRLAPGEQANRVMGQMRLPF